MFKYFLNSRPVHDMQAWRDDAIKSWKSSKINLPVHTTVISSHMQCYTDAIF